MCNYSQLLFKIIVMMLCVKLGQGLECFICHSRHEKECIDPFEGNRTDSVDCKRVRDVGLGVIAAAAALGAMPGKYSPLAQPPHVCFKLISGQHLIRGCGKPDVCQNYTETECDTCDTDGCNHSPTTKPLNAALILPLILFMY